MLVLPVRQFPLAGTNCAGGDLLTPPTSDEKDGFPPLERYEFHITEKSDIVFEGLGWITVPAKTTVAAWVPKGVGALVRRAMI